MRVAIELNEYELNYLSQSGVWYSDGHKDILQKVEDAVKAVQLAERAASNDEKMAVLKQNGYILNPVLCRWVKVDTEQEFFSLSAAWNYYSYELRNQQK